MINITAVVSDLGPSQKSFYFIKNFNELSKNPNFFLLGFCL